MYQTKRRTKAVSSLKILAAVGLTLGLSSWALGQDCGAGDVASAEPCLVDFDSDTTNSGCNDDPVNFEAAVIGGSISGSVSTYIAHAACPGDVTGPGGDGVPDQTVDTNDLLYIFANWGDSGGFGQADVSGSGGDGIPDGTVNTNDLLFIFAEWGDCPADVSRRDTDWYLVSPAQLLAADTDGNGLVVLSSSASSEAPVLLFVVALGDPQCTGAAVIGQTGWAGPGCAEVGAPSQTLIDIAAHPHGIAFWIGTGSPAQGAIYTGYPCANRVTDYLLQLSISELHETCTFEGEPCNVVTGVPGCNDPFCCDLVCAIDVVCCEEEWDAFCVNSAVNDVGCALGNGAPVFLATGTNDTVDGYLDLFADGFGSESVAFGGGPNWPDHYNPVNGDLSNPGFTTTSFLFTGGTDRQCLSLHSGVLSAGWAGSTMTALFDSPPVASDVFGGDGVDDTVVNHFTVTGALTLDVTSTQSVETLLAEGGNPIATWKLSYEIRNDGGAATFDIIRWIDGDLMWIGGPGDDIVGTGTIAGVGCDTFVYMSETGSPNFGITLSTDAPGARYVGSKLTWDVDCTPKDPGSIPPFGFGTDPDPFWNLFGMPVGLENLIAGLGYDTDGDSGEAPVDGCGNIGDDASVGLVVTVSLGVGETTTVTFVQTYGAITPLGVTCSQ